MIMSDKGGPRAVVSFGHGKASAAYGAESTEIGALS